MLGEFLSLPRIIMFSPTQKLPEHGPLKASVKTVRHRPPQKEEVCSVSLALAFQTGQVLHLQDVALNGHGQRV